MTTPRSVVMTDVARVAGVSLKTVSRVVNDADHVRPEVRARVHAAIEQLGFRRNGAARALAAGRTRLLGIVAMGSPLFGIAQHVMSIERAAQDLGYGTVVVSTVNTAADHDLIRPAVARALELGAEGVIIVEPSWRHPPDLSGLADIPLIVPSGADAHSRLHRHVAPAERSGAVLAADHLMTLGHELVGHIRGPLAWHTSVLREAGWREALEGAGLQTDAVAGGDWSPRSGYDAMRELLSRRPGMTALFAANDAMAMGALHAAAEAGLRVPDDLAVVGFDDVPEAEFQAVPLSSVRQDFSQLARRAVEHVAGALDGRRLSEEPILVPAQLVVRASSAARTGEEVAPTP